MRTRSCWAEFLLLGLIWMWCYALTEAGVVLVLLYLPGGGDGRVPRTVCTKGSTLPTTVLWVCRASWLLSAVGNVSSPPARVNSLGRRPGKQTCPV